MIPAIKILAVIILLSFAANHSGEASDFHIGVALVEIALSIVIIITLIKPLIKKL